MKNENDRPKVICLMMSSLDGKILGESWGSGEDVESLTAVFEKIHEKIGIKAWICGRSTMEKDFTHAAPAIYKPGGGKISREDHNAAGQSESFAIAVDGHGKLGWKNSLLNGDHVITILLESVEDSYLAHLKDIGVSYLFAGKDSINLETALKKLKKNFGIGHLMLEGGGKLNGSFLEANLIDEFHQLLLPLIDAKESTSTIFEVKNELRKDLASLMKLEEITRLKNDVLWLKYTVKK